MTNFIVLQPGELVQFMPVIKIFNQNGARNGQWQVTSVQPDGSVSLVRVQPVARKR